MLGGRTRSRVLLRDTVVKLDNDQALHTKQMTPTDNDVDTEMHTLPLRNILMVNYENEIV